MLDVAVLAITYGVVLPAELPDKTAVAVLVLSTRYRAWPVFAGVAAAFAVHVVLALAAGGMLTLLPHRALQAVFTRPWWSEPLPVHKNVNNP